MTEVIPVGGYSTVSEVPKKKHKMLYPSSSFILVGNFSLLRISSLIPEHELAMGWIRPRISSLLAFVRLEFDTARKSALDVTFGIDKDGWQTNNLVLPFKKKEDKRRKTSTNSD